MSPIFPLFCCREVGGQGFQVKAGKSCLSLETQCILDLCPHLPFMLWYSGFKLGHPKHHLPIPLACQDLTCP